MARFIKVTPEVITGLQAMLNLEAHLNIQYRKDARVAKRLGAGKTKSKLKYYGNCAHKFQESITDRLLAVGADPEIDMETVTAQDNLTDIFNNFVTLETALMNAARDLIKVCTAGGDETTAEKLRHIQERHEDHISWLDIQLNLIDANDEGEYILEMA